MRFCSSSTPTPAGGAPHNARQHQGSNGVCRKAQPCGSIHPPVFRLVLAGQYPAKRLPVEASVQLEPGVLTLYAVAEKNNPTHITILEIYADTVSYKAHLQTPHFIKYKNGTKDMVKSLELVETIPLVPGMKIKG